MGNNKILILGPSGFIGSNLLRYLNNKYIVNCYSISNHNYRLEKLIAESDIIIHCIGVTRSLNENDFYQYNIDFSYQLYAILCKFKNKKIIYFSSIHFHKNDLYGFTKRYNEYLFTQEEFRNIHKLFLIRTPGIFGPGAKPNNVSVVSTFCYNIVNNIKSTINDPEKVLEIAYIDDLISLIEGLFESNTNLKLIQPESVKISVIGLYNLIENIASNKKSFNIDGKYSSSFIENIKTTYNSFKYATK